MKMKSFIVKITIVVFLLLSTTIVDQTLGRIVDIEKHPSAITLCDPVFPPDD